MNPFLSRNARADLADLLFSFPLRTYAALRLAMTEIMKVSKTASVPCLQENDSAL